jgi:hypothetical protein
MKLLKIGTYLINPQCIVQAWTNFDASEIKVCLSCNNSVAGVESICVREKEGQLEKVEDVYFTFIGEEAETLKSYFSRADLSDADLSGAIVEKAQFGENTGLSEEMKLDLKQRGAIFKD